MSIIKTPTHYLNQAGSLGLIGPLLREATDSALVVTGERAWAAAGGRVGSSLADAGVKAIRDVYRGYPTVKAACGYAHRARDGGAGTVIGVGGGRILDLAKGAAALAGLPFVAVPTVAATCAAFSDLTVFYCEDGGQDHYTSNPEAPQLVIADPDVLLAAPLRYLHSGVADSIAKYYEVQSSLNGNSDNLLFDLQVKVCELIKEVLENRYLSARRTGGPVSDELLRDVLDANIMLPGLVGAVKGNVPYNGFGHLFYNQYTKLAVAEERRRLHGEAVCYGLAVQWVVEGKSDTHVSGRLRDFALIGQPVTLADLGLDGAPGDDADASAAQLARLMKKFAEVYSSTASALSETYIAEAIRTVDALGRELVAAP
ncbi:MAG: iron-containing alcohol dehydrogenase [Coriobacteriales bacterium]|nr:iron-containing alcohol dehydrogenase [Coriobacteriales bacterium]